MLQSLHIENYVLIKSLDIDFAKGFSVITGETGSGKSVILGAVNLCLGGRAEQRVIREGERRCVVEACFGLDGCQLESFFEENGLEYDPQCILRREITDNGKSRLFLNDSPCPVGVVKALGERLIDIHSQHNNLLLREDSFQLQVIDAMAGSTALLSDYHKQYSRCNALEKELKELTAMAEKQQGERDYIEFQYRQLAEAQLHDGEQEDLEAERLQLEHAGEIQTALQTASACLQDDNGILSQLHFVEHQLDSVCHVDSQLESLCQRMRSAAIELKDSADEIRRKADRIEDNPQRLDEVSQRLDTIYSLEQKHRAAGIGELLRLQAELERQLSGIDNFDEEKTRLEKELAQARQAMQQASDALTRARMAVKDEIERRLSESLKQLGIPYAQVRIDRQAVEPGPRGCDQITFMFSGNRASAPKPVVQIASGGEMARLMLCIKSMIATKTQLPTIIFDEIDTGISGETAAMTGNILRQMAGSTQVICITHLPQIAAKGELHYRVFKTEKDTTETNMVRLDAESRVQEIAKMVSGDTITDAAVSNARELLQGN